MTRCAPLLLLAGLCLAPADARAWDLETHVGLTQRAAHKSHLDAWLRARGLAEGLFTALSLRPSAHASAGGERLDDRDVLDELATIDPELGVVPDGARQPALAWLLAGAALEGARMDRIRNHFVDPKHGGERVRLGGADPRPLEEVRDGLGTLRGVMTGSNYDGTGVRADRWADAAPMQNAMSRRRLLDELYAASAAPTSAEREAALARVLVCAGAIAHVLEAVGDPAHARGDFTVNYTVAGAPLERWAQERYGLLVPAPNTSSKLRTRLAAFFTAPDGSGLADDVARSFVSPGTLPGTPGALPQPYLVAGPQAEGTLAGPRVHHLVAYKRVGGGVRYSIPPVAIAEMVDALLPQIASEAADLLDFLFDGALAITDQASEAGTALTIRVGARALGPGQIELLAEREDGRRDRLLVRPTAGGASDAVLVTLDHATLAGGAVAGARNIIAIYRGVDGDDEPVVLSAARAPGP